MDSIGPPEPGRELPSAGIPREGLLPVGNRRNDWSISAKYSPTGRQSLWTLASIVLAYCLEKGVLVKSRTKASGVSRQVSGVRS
jgi:hypothetical protein